MKRAVLCVPNPQDFIDQLDDYSIMIVNPASATARVQYLLDHADWSVKITDTAIEHRSGSDYGEERLFWYTSGTTGDSKFCSFTQAQLDHMCETIIKAYDITANDRYVGVMPLWHAHGQGFYWATRRAGCQVDFLTIKTIRNLEWFSPTFITAVPDLLRIVAQMNFDHLRFVRGASAPLPDQLFKHLQQQFGVPVIEAFGMTEALSHCFTNPLHGEQRMGTVGLPDGIEADIVDGELFIKGPSLFCNGWYNTGDLACQDSEGYFRILGRSQDQINVRGIKLNPVSLEKQIRTTVPGIKECVIFGSDSVKCLYTGDCDPGEIKNFLISLGVHCRPALLEQVDTIPLSPSEKISRSWLDRQWT